MICGFSSMRAASRLFFLSLLLLSSAGLRAQDQTRERDARITLSGHYGFLISHHSTMRYLVKGHVGGMELTWAKPTYGEQQWHRIYDHPTWGFSYIHLDLANPKVLGNLDGLYGFINFPKGRKKRTNIRVGLGLAYLSQRFDRLENHKNIAIGSHLNGLISLGINRDFKLSKHLRLATAISLTHASNGSSKVPNLGINIPTVSLGLTYDLAKEARKKITDSLPAADEKVRYTAIAASGFTEIEPVGGKKYIITEVMGHAAWPLGHAWHVTGGIDLMYNPANIEKLERDTIAVSGSFQNMQPGVKLGGEMFIGRLSMPLEMGVYLYTKMKRNGLIYHRLGLRYQLNERWLVNFTMKTHFAKADYLAWGVGYRF